MKWLALGWLVSAASVNVSEQATLPRDAELIPMHRFWDGAHHFYTLNPIEPNRTTFKEEGRPILIQRAPPDRRYVPIYRCYARTEGVHFISLDPACDGETAERPYGYISAVPRPGYAPLFALYNRAINDQVVTTNYGEGIDHGYTLQMVLGFVPQM